MSSRRPSSRWNRESKTSSEPSRRRSRSRYKRYRRLFDFESLETRVLLATLDFAGGTLTYSAGVGALNSLTLSATAIDGSGYQFIENGETITAVSRLPISCTSTPVPSNTVTINCAAPNDITALAINLDDGADTLVLLSTDDPTQIDGGSENDVIRIGDALNSLDGILGVIDIDGGANAAQPIVSRTVTAGATVISNDLPEGDRLIVNDVADNDANSYKVDDNTVTRGGLLAITFAGIESLDLIAGIGVDVIDVIATADSTTTSIATTGGGDSVTVTTTGAASNLDVTGDAAVNLLHILTTGNNSVTLLAGGGGNDALLQTANGIGSGVALNGEGGQDTITIQSSSAGSATRGDGGINSDTGNVGNAANSLDDIGGEVEFLGGDHDLGNTLSRGVIAGATAVTSTLEVGDALNLNDQGTALGHTLTLATNNLQRSGNARLIHYSQTETLGINAGTGTDTIDVTGTAAQSRTVVNTTAGGDTLHVMGSGTGSILEAVGDAGVNTLDVQMTGNNSVTILAGGGGNDALLQTANGIGSGVALNGEAGEDTMTVLGSTAGSATAADGGDDNDVSNAGDATHSLDPILGAVIFHGGANGAATRNLATIVDSDLPAQPFSVGSRFNPVSSIATAVGDALRISDASKSGNQTYEIDPGQTGRTGVSPRTLLYTSMESLSLTAGSGADQVDVAVPDGGTQLPSLVTINGGGAEDNLVHVNAQSGPHRIILDTERDDSQVRAPFEIRNANRLNVTGSLQDDVVLSKLSAGQLLGGSLIDGGLGNDVLCSGSNLDLLVGGAGADFLCSNGGNTILLPDHAIKGGVLSPINPPFGQDGDLIQLGENDSAIPLGADLIKGADGGCGKLSLSGAFQLDVLCWLKAQFQATLPTTGSNAPLVRFELLTAAPSGSGEGESAGWHNRLRSTDVNGDGATNPFDALLIINTLNADGPRRLANLPVGEGEGNAGAARTFYDVNNDRFVTPADVLIVINSFRAGDSVELAAVGEGEGAPAPENALRLVQSPTRFGLIAAGPSDSRSDLASVSQSVGRRVATTQLCESTVRPAIATVQPATDALQNRVRLIQPDSCLGEDLLSLLATDVMERSQGCDARDRIV